MTNQIKVVLSLMIVLVTLVNQCHGISCVCAFNRRIYNDCNGYQGYCTGNFKCACPALAHADNFLDKAANRILGELGLSFIEMDQCGLNEERLLFDIISHSLMIKSHLKSDDPISHIKGMLINNIENGALKMFALMSFMKKDGYEILKCVNKENGNDGMLPKIIVDEDYIDMGGFDVFHKTIFSNAYELITKYKKTSSKEEESSQIKLVKLMHDIGSDKGSGSAKGSGSSTGSLSPIKSKI